MKYTISSRGLLLLLLFIPSVITFSQKTEWMTGFDGHATGGSTVCNNSKGNVLLVSASTSSANYDSFEYRNYTIYGNDASNLILTEVTPSDSILWLFTTKLDPFQHLNPIDITVDDKDNIYVLVEFSDTVKISYNVILKGAYPNAKRVGIIKFNPGGKPLWAKQFGPVSNNNAIAYRENKIIYCKGRVYIAYVLSNSFKFDGALHNYIANNSSNYAILSYDTSGNFLFTKQYGEYYPIRYDFNVSESYIYMSAVFDNRYVDGKDTINPGFVLLKTDMNGSIENYVELKSNYSKTLQAFSGLRFSIDPDNQSVYLTFNFVDSFNLLNYNVSVPNKNSNNYADSISTCILKVNQSLTKVEWCKCRDSISNGILSPMTGITIKNDNLYITGSTFGRVQFDGIDLTVPNDNNIKLFILKMDTLGNSLWGFATQTGGKIRLMDISVDMKGDIYPTGSFNGKVKIFNDSLLNSNVWETFLAKILDYEITRGEVNSGPYCAGDTLKIPYIQVGVYDTANYFIAELSDEKGNFEGDERELGRVKTTEDSTILGELPMFQVASSGNYRIRVRSTHPPVQSYYQFDSLRLLIYSRDKANPGPPELVCTGDSFQLNTFGGTAWQWSPNHHMDNNTLRQPKVLPDTNIAYRIIISDSSGCGEADTAFKELVVRKDPVISFDKNDSTVCMASTTAIVAAFSFGDTAAYHWQWLEVDTAGLTKLLAIDSNLNVVPRQLDTLNYTLSPQVTDSQQLMLVLTDNCSKNTDTAYFTLYIQQQKEKATAGFQDTAICPQTEVQITAGFTLGNNTYSWSWWQENKLLERDTGKQKDSLKITPDFSSKDTLIYSLILSDQCSPIQDTLYYTVTPRDTLKILTRYTDTTLCKGQTLRLQATASGGVPDNYQWSWTDAQGKELSADYDLKVTADSQMQIKLKLEDGCMPMGDSLSFVLNITPPLKAAILADNSIAKDTTLCFGNALNLKGQSTGGKGADYDFQWLLDGDLISDDSMLHYNFSEKPDTQHTFQLVVSDNCTPRQDTTELKVRVGSQLKVDAALPDTLCRGGEVQLTAFPSGGLKKDYTFQWIWHNQTISTDSATLQVLDNPKEGMDTLLLVLSDGCTIPKDTLVTPLFFRPPLHLAITSTDNCTTDSLVITAETSGGLKTGHQLKWWDENNQTLGTQPMLTVTPKPVNTYWAVLTDGCTTSPDTASVTVGKTPTLNVSTIPNQGCEPLEVTFKLKTEYTGHYQWVFEDGKGAQTTFTPEDSMVVEDYTRGSYTPALELTTDFGCVVDWQSAGLTVFPKPIADFIYQPEKPSLDSPEVHFKNLSVDADSFVWDLGGYGKSTEEQPIVLYEAEGKYPIQLIAKNIYQCSDTARGFLTVKPGYFIYLPNAFSPNGDGLNDRFSPVASGIDIIEFEIYNRWGECMFKGQQGDSWDGTYLGKPVPPGVYVCVLPVAAKDQNNERVRGSFLLIR